MISLACCTTSVFVKPSKRSAAFIIIAGFVETPNVNVAGTATLIFPLDNAPFRSISVAIGSNDNTP